MRQRSRPQTFQDQIDAEKARIEKQLVSARNSVERDALSRKVRQLDTASHLNEWLSSPGLRPPKK